MKLKNSSFIFTALFLIHSGFLLAQDPAAIRSKCQSELADINNKIIAHNAEYEKIKSDLRAGLFCSLCGRSKTELDKAEGFYVHLKNVKGSPVAATPQQMNNAYQRYLEKYNSLKSDYDSKSKSCDDNYNNAVKQQNEDAERARQDALNEQLEKQKQAQNDQLERQKQAQENIDRINQAEQDRKQQMLQQLQQQQEERRQQVLEQSEKNKQDAVKMFTDDANQMKSGINDITMPSDKIGFDNQVSHFGLNPSDRPVTSNMDDFNFDKSEFSTNSYFEEYSDQVKDITTEQIITETELPEVVKNGYEALQKFQTFLGVGRGLEDGNITPEMVDATFSPTQNAIISKIETTTGHVIVKNGNTAGNLLDRMSSDDFSEKDLDNAMNSMNPFHFESTHVTESKPLSFKDGAMIVGGGIVLTAIGAPIWMGIGAAAWYGFNR